MDATPFILEVHNLTKAFGDFIANHNINFNLKRGEIHCLLGENGAGKSTFAKCLYGAYREDSGIIKINGKKVTFDSPKDAIQLGIGMVHQHFVLVPTMSAIENIVVGVKKPGLSIGIQEAKNRVLELCNKFQITIDLEARLDELPIGQQQWVEILKALYSGVDILILDEPTATLTPQESEQLFKIIKRMTKDGTSVIFITHKLHEVLKVSDRTTIFRNGKVIGTVQTSEVDKMELAVLMVGRGVHFDVDKDKLLPQEPILVIRDLCVTNRDGRHELESVNLTVRKHEILGIAGVGGNGQNALFDSIVGVRSAAQGKILLNGHEIQNQNPVQIMKSGLASIPSDRMTQGLLLDFSVSENLIIGRHWDPPFCSGVFLDQQKIMANARELIKEYDIATTSPQQMASRLSGGNLQKIILARELSRKLRCVIAFCPTRGLDVGAIEYVHERLVQLRDEGVGVLLISEDLDEIFNVVDRIAVIFKGTIVGDSPTSKTSREQVGLLMAGVMKGSNP
jgi:general nucleoside transport system ATP-binding protein